MKVLFFNEFTSIAGGVDEVVRYEIDGLKKSNVEVELFNYNNKEFNDSSSLKKIIILLYSLNGRFLIEEFQKKINYFSPDVIHFHNIYQLFRFPIWKLLDTKKSKVVVHLHNYYSFCLNSFFFTNNSICIKCKENNSWMSGIKNKCYDDNFLKTFYVSVNRAIPNEWLKLSANINMFLAVSNFVKNKFVELGLSENKIYKLENPISLNENHFEITKRNYVLYLGNIKIAKGIKIFCETAKNLPEINFIAAGDGCNLSEMKAKYSEIKNLKFVGYVKDEKKDELIKNCRFLFLPSLCWETFGIAILEGYVYGKPVLSTGFGGTKELIIENKTGKICNEIANDNFKKMVKEFWNILETDYESYSINCKKFAEDFNFENHTKKLISIYNSIL